MVILAQDLSLFRNIKALSRDLKAKQDPLKEEQFDWESLKVDPRTYLEDQPGNRLNSGVLSNLSTLYFSEILLTENLQPENAENHEKRRQGLE